MFIYRNVLAMCVSDLHDVQPVGVGPDEYAGGVGERQAGGERGGLLRQPLHAGGVRALARRPHRALEVIRHGEAEPALGTLAHHLERFYNHIS